MKIQLDYDNNTILLPEACNLAMFIKTIKRILPDWKDWELLPNTKIKKVNWTRPFYVPHNWDRWWYGSPGYTNYGNDYSDFNFGSPATHIINSSDNLVSHDITDGKAIMNSTSVSTNWTLDPNKLSGIYSLDIEDK